MRAPAHPHLHTNTHPQDSKAAAYSALDFAAMSSEVDATEAACAAAGSPVVFGHCDLLSGNILILQQPGFDPVSNR